MNSTKLKDNLSTELEAAETVFSRDIENKVFKTIVYQTLSTIEGVKLVEESFLDNFLKKASLENIKGIHAELNSQCNAVSIRVEINVLYGMSIPEKSEEIQSKINDAIHSFTGIHVDAIHVIFKNVILPDTLNQDLSESSEQTIACEEKSTALLDA